MPSSAPSAPHVVEFPPFQLDLRGGILRRATAPVALRPKTFAVLQHLAEHPGELVTKQALLDVVWGDVSVTEDVVRISIGELRVALGDERAAPRFIETVPRRGYRFVAATGAASISTSPPMAAPQGDDASGSGLVVGRARERAAITEAFHDAATGRRQVVFVSGEAGIGKTTLVDAALEDLRRATGPQPRIGRGQCVEQYGGGEPYLPVLEVMAAVCRGAEGQTAEASLRQHAPGWLLRVVGLAPSVPGAAASTHEHTLHQLAVSVTALCAETPLVLVLEDLQWSDHATLDLLSVLAQRREPARLLVLCTLRPADAIVHGHPGATVKRELLRKGQARELLLDGLSESDIARYLAARFGEAALPDALLRLFVDRSEGNPLFVGALIDHLLHHELLVQRDGRWELRASLETLLTVVPEELRAVIEPLLERLGPDELQVLETASVIGLEFPAHAVARVAPRGSDLGDVETVETVCDALVRRQDILRSSGESTWPDGTESARYAFRHVLYQHVVSGRLAASTRRRLHQVTGEALEAAYGTRTPEVASELAARFERSGDIVRAVRYHREAAAHAASRCAHEEARIHLESALALVREQPETLERLRQQVPLLEQLGTTLFAMRGYGDEGGARAFAQIREIAERLDGAEARVQAMEGQLIVHTMRAELATARILGEEMIVLTEQLGNTARLANAHALLSATLFDLGEVEAAHLHAERGRALFDPEATPLQTDVGIQSCILLGSACVYLGRVAQARVMNQEALACAARLATPFHRALATNLASQVCMLLDDVPEARSLAQEALQLANGYDFSMFRIWATMVRAWTDVEQGRVEDGLPVLEGAFAEFGGTGQRYGTTAFSMVLARSHLAAGDAARAAAVVDAALAFVTETGERVYEAELHRVQGECFRARADRQGARRSYERALAIAAEHKALLFELRAATSLLRLRGKAARERVIRLVDRFEPEDDCADLRAARALLAR